MLFLFSDLVLSTVSFPRAEQHGEQMLNLISRILSSHYHDALQVAMALEGVVSLCQHEVVDVVTVWTVLGKGGRLTSDLRPAVQVALCSLFGLATELNSDLSHSHKVNSLQCCVVVSKNVFFLFLLGLQDLSTAVSLAEHAH